MTSRFDPPDADHLVRVITTRYASYFEGDQETTLNEIYDSGFPDEREVQDFISYLTCERWDDCSESDFSEENVTRRFVDEYLQS